LGLNVGDAAEVRGTTEAGVFYGTQTLLQILKAVSGHRAVPRGAARDWPQQAERGLLLDAGRHYYSPDFIVQQIHEMAYLKLNTLHRNCSGPCRRAATGLTVGWLLV
jgi:hexosaminidase